MKRLLLTVKVLLSIGLLAYLFSSVEITTLSRMLQQARFLPLLGAFVVMLLGILLSVYKWQVLLRVDGIDPGIGELFNYYLVGIYFNNFLPTSMGGDAMRGYLVARSNGQRMAALTSILAERFTGVLGLLVIALIGIVLSPSLLSAEWVIWVSVVLLLGLAIPLLVFKGYFQKVTCALLPARLAGYTQHFWSRFQAYSTDSQVVWTVIWTSLIFQILTILVYSVASLAIGIEIPFRNLMAVVPLVTLATLLPLSLNGLGIREGGFVLLLSVFGYSSESALLLSLSVYVLTLILSLIGALLFLVMKRSINRGDGSVNDDGANAL